MLLFLFGGTAYYATQWKAQAGPAALPDRVTLARGKRPPKGEPVVDRALSLLSAFDAGQRRLTLAELSRRSGIPVSTTLRLATRAGPAEPPAPKTSAGRRSSVSQSCIRVYPFRRVLVP